MAEKLNAINIDMKEEETKMEIAQHNRMMEDRREEMDLVGICRMSACRPEVQNVRHEMSGPTCRQHVGRHVGDMVQKCVVKGTDMTRPNVGFCDMSAPCQLMHKT